MMRPASASAFVWWLTVGCDLPSGSSRSHEHTSSVGRDEAEQPEPHRIRQCGEPAGELLGLGLVERAVEDRRTALGVPITVVGMAFVVAFVVIRDSTD